MLLKTECHHLAVSLLLTAALLQLRASAQLVPNPSSSPIPEGISLARNEQQLSLDLNTSVAIHSGEVHYRATDIQFPGVRGMDLAFVRIYRSQVTYTGPLGQNWSHSFDQRVYLQGSELKHVDGERLQVDSYIQTASTLYECQTPGLYRKARLEASGNWKIRDRFGRVRTFLPLDGSPSEGRLASIGDSFGNMVLCSYDILGRLDTVTGTALGALHLGYGAQNRIAVITDDDNRSWTYRYTPAGDLISVTSPGITGTPTGPGGSNDFPAGKTTRYLYTPSAQPAWMGRNLSAIIYPNQASPLILSPGAPKPSRSTSATPTPATTGQGMPAPFPLQQPGITSVLSLAAVRLKYQQDKLSVATIADPNEPDGVDVSLVYQISNYVNEASETIVTKPDQHVTTYGFDALGSLLRTEEVVGGVNLISTYAVNGHGEFTTITKPAGNVYTIVFDDTNPDLFQQGNILQSQHTPSPVASGTAQQATTQPLYEPVYNREISTQQSEKTVYLDYQEGDPDTNGLNALVSEWGIDLGSFGVGLNQDLNGDGVTNQIGGNTIWTQGPLVTTGVSLPVQIEEFSTYDSQGRRISETNGEGALTVYLYGADGLLGARIEDADPALALIPNAGTSNWTKPVWVGHVSATTLFVHDSRGNVIQTTDPRGVQTSIQVNAHNQVVLETRGSGTDPTLLEATLQSLLSAGSTNLVSPAYLTYFQYDANGNTIRIDRENRGSGQTGNTWLTTLEYYDVINQLVREKEEISEGVWAESTFDYDTRGNLVKLVHPEGNVDTFTYDQQERIATITQGASDPATASTVTYTYDVGGRVAAIEGPDDFDGDGKNEQTMYTYDGRGRLYETISPTGGVRRETYSPYDEGAGYQLWGTTGGASPSQNNSAGNVLLAETVNVRDEIGRLVRIDEHVFVAGTPPLPYAAPDHWISTTFQYDRNGNRIVATDPNGDFTTQLHDGLDRLVKLTDPVGNQMTVTYDAGGHIVLVSQLEMSSSGGPSETKTVHNVWDGLGRLIRTTDVMGKTKYFAYDSSDRRVAEADADGPELPTDPLGVVTGSINAPGNTKRFIFDGLGHATASYTDLYLAGVGIGLDLFSPTFDPTQDPPITTLDTGANPDGVLRTSFLFDSNGNVTQATADTGRTIVFAYDDQDRQVAKTLPDGTSILTQYFRGGNVRSRTMFGSDNLLFRRLDYSYDASGRLTDTHAILPAGTTIEGSTQQAFQYNGLGLPTSLTDDNGGPPFLASSVSRVYDSKGNVVQEMQNGTTLSRQLDNNGNRSSLWYPNGRNLSFGYDGLNRLTMISETGGTILAAFDYFGADRLARITLGNGTVQTLEVPPAGSGWLTGYDPSGLPTNLQHETASGALLTRLGNVFDRSGHRLNEVRQIGSLGSSISNDMEYDSAGRLERFLQDTPNGGVPALAQTYAYDGDSSWTTLTLQATGQSPSVYPVTTGAAWGTTSIAGTLLGSDTAGNRTSDAWFLYFYDVYDRLVRIAQRLPGGNEGTTLLRFSYDAEGRRIEKRSFEGMTAQTSTHYIHEGNQVVEERNALGATIAQYVVASRTDELLQMKRDADQDQVLEDYYYLPDTIGSIVALTDDSGNVVERYSYDAFGGPTFLAPDGTKASDLLNQPLITSAFGNPYLFQGREYDDETAIFKSALASWGYFAEWDHALGQYYFRARYADPEEGRFSSRDLISLSANYETGQPSVLVNRILGAGFSESPFVFSDADPVNRTDPMGLAASTNLVSPGTFDPFPCTLKPAIKGIKNTGKGIGTRVGSGLVKGLVVGQEVTSFTQWFTGPDGVWNPAHCWFAGKGAYLTWNNLSAAMTLFGSDGANCASAKVQLGASGVSDDKCVSAMLKAQGRKCGPTTGPPPTSLTQVNNGIWTNDQCASFWNVNKGWGKKCDSAIAVMFAGECGKKPPSDTPPPKAPTKPHTGTGGGIITGSLHIVYNSPCRRPPPGPSGLPGEEDPPPTGGSEPPKGPCTGAGFNKDSTKKASRDGHQYKEGEKFGMATVPSFSRRHVLAGLLAKRTESGVEIRFSARLDGTYAFELRRMDTRSMADDQLVAQGDSRGQQLVRVEDREALPEASYLLTIVDDTGHQYNIGPFQPKQAKARAIAAVVSVPPAPQRSDGWRWLVAVFAAAVCVVPPIHRSVRPLAGG